MFEKDSVAIKSEFSPKPLFDIRPLQSALARGQLILTPNQRLARAIQQAWGLHCRERGKSSWKQAPVYAIDHWLEACWQDLRDSGFEPVLDAAPAPEHTELFLWSQIISADERTPPSSSINGLAHLARQARQYLALWPGKELDFRNTASIFRDHQGYQLLLDWLPRLHEALARLNLLTPEQTLSLIKQGFTETVLPKQEIIHLVGFQILPPAQHQLLETAATEISELKPAGHSGNCQITALADSDAEMAGAAHWAQARLQSGAKRVGIVFPNLPRIRKRVERQFRSVLEPDYCLPCKPNSPPPFNISAGTPLAQTGLVEAALTLLTLNESEQPLAFYCAILNNPFWADSRRETELRGNAEVQLRELDRVQIKASDFRSVIQRARKNLKPTHPETDPDTDISNTDAPGPSARLQAAAHLARRQPVKQTFLAWAHYIAEFLDTVGWPGSRTLDSIEYQQLLHWQQTLDHFVNLDTAKAQVTWPEALSQLRQLANKIIFQPQTPDSPIQVLGVLEAAGLSFDALWVAGMGDEEWPQTVQMQPLLPAKLQKQAAMPRTDAGRELTLSRAIISGFSRAAKEIVFSYPERDGDVEKRPSPLLQEIATQPSSSDSSWVRTTLDHPLARHLANTPAREWVQWEQAPMFSPQSEKLRGGSSLLRDQAACPFNAFARWRLGAKPLPEPVPGLSALERGNLTHRCLELLWRRIGAQNALLTLSERERTEQLGEVIDTALSEAATCLPELNGLRLRRIESTRLARLLQRWLALEAERPPFIVAASEHSITLTLNLGKAGAPLLLPLRIDRIDLLADGRLALIDYKTGRTNISGWGGIRPEQPQLPLYALGIMGDEHGLKLNNFDFKPKDPKHPAIAALCFAQISNAQGLALTGVTDDPDSWPLRPLGELGLAETWDKTVDQWREHLETIAEEFVEGEAEIVYYTGATEHQNYLLPLNRLPELDDIRALQETERNRNNSSGVNP